MENEKVSPFDKVNIDELSSEERRKLADPNYVASKMGVSKSGNNSNLENKMYVIFIVSDIGEHECSYLGQTNIKVNGEFAICNGRKEAYEFIKALLDEDVDWDIDLDESSVLTEGVSCSEKISMYRFMKYCEKYFPDDDFDIDGYYNGFEEEQESYHGILASGSGYSMASMLLNNTNIKEETKEEK